MSPDGTKWPPPRKFATGYAVAIAVLIINLIITFWNLNSISRTWDALALSHDIVVGLDDVLSNLRDAETGQRGYLLTGDERYLEPYTKSHAVVAASIDRLRSLVANNGVRREHLNAVAEAASPSSPSWHRRSDSAGKAVSTPPSRSSRPTAAGPTWIKSAARSRRWRPKRTRRVSA